MEDDVTLARWLNGEMDEQELKAFMASPGYETYQKITKYSAQLEAPEINLDNLYGKIESAKYKPVRVRRLNPWVGRIAAVLLLALGVAFYMFTTHITTQATGNAQTAAFMLPDESSVALNAGSTAAFKEWNWNSNRKVELQGEAFFKVAKGKIFDVITPAGTVTVVGTQFNVKARGSRLDVSCYEGRVRVASGEEVMLLTPGKTVAYESGRRVANPSHLGSEPKWIVHEAEFNAETLENVVAELERQFNVTITLTQLSEKRFTGTIPTDDLDNALEMLKFTYHLSAKKQGNTIILASE